MSRIREVSWREGLLDEQTTPAECLAWLRADPTIAVFAKQLRHVEFPAEARATRILKLVPRQHDRSISWPYIPPFDGSSSFELIHVPVDGDWHDLSDDALADAVLTMLGESVRALATARLWPVSGILAAELRARAELGLPGGDAHATADPDEPLPVRPEVSDALWAWLDLLGGVADRTSTDRLAAALRAAGPQAIDQFETDLSLALRDLASNAHFRQATRIGADDDDTFEVIRLEVIAAGESAWRAAIANPRLLGKHTAGMVGEYLSTVAYQARRSE